MSKSKNQFWDNEYIIMSEIMDNENITQRELSKKLGISVSTVNVLVNKMIKEGLIKMTLVSQKQVLYMLTPVGMMEKVKKTGSYLKAHYRAIYQTKEKMVAVFEELNQAHDAIFVLICDDEVSEIIGSAVKEFRSKNDKSRIEIIDNRSRHTINNFNSPVLVHMTTDEEILKEYNNIVDLKILNLTEKL